MSELIDRIVDTKNIEVGKLLEQKSLLDWEKEFPIINKPNVKGYAFAKAIRRNFSEKVKTITECKKASPSLGLLREDYDPLAIANIYKEIGASAISVLTDKDYFQGSLNDLKKVITCGLPVIRKDFIVSPVQIYQAKKAGASAILLIVRILNQGLLTSLYNLASSLELDVLVETHNEKEVERAMSLGALIIGINHRNLDTLEMDLSLTSKLAPSIRKINPNVILVAESGVENPVGVQIVEKYIDAILIGSALVSSSDIKLSYESIFK